MATAEAAVRGPYWTVLVPVAVAVLGGALFFWPMLISGRNLTPQDVRERMAGLSAPPESASVDLDRLSFGAKAIEQLARRSRNGERAFVELCALLPANAQHQNPLVRRAVARAMGEAAWDDGYLPALHRMLADEDELVQRLAAESLAAWERMEGREILLRSLEPRVVVSPYSGRLIAGLEKDVRINRSGQLAFIEIAGKERKKVFAPITGYVASMLKSGSEVEKGQKLAVLLPGVGQVWRALRGLYLVGQTVDIDRIETALKDRHGLGRDVYRQRSETIEMIEERARRGIKVGRIKIGG